MPKLIAVVIVGVAVVAIVSHLLGSSSDTATSTVAAPELQQAQPSKNDVSADVTDTHTQSPSIARTASQPTTTTLTVEQQNQAACIAQAQRRQARERAVLAAEPKEPTWAYPMEQKLREFMTQRFAASEIELIGIDCKTTFCELEANVFAPEASTEFSAAISAVPGAPWNDFTGAFTSQAEEGGKGLHYAQLRRKQFGLEVRDTSEDERAEAACMARSLEKQRRERAARDAQPVDTSWAAPTEQLLRQSLTTQLVKHPVEHIEIACKTTFCQIKARGRTKESRLALQKAVATAVDEPWSDLRVGGSGGSGYGDHWTQDYSLERGK